VCSRTGGWPLNGPSSTINYQGSLFQLSPEAEIHIKILGQKAVLVLKRHLKRNTNQQLKNDKNYRY
jgi:hypothetical protein